MYKIVEIYNSLILGQKSISELQRELNIHRDTITNNLEILKDLNLVHERKYKNKRIMIANDHIGRPSNKDSYFELPLEKNDKIICHYIFSKINDAWAIEYSNRPPIAIVQKIVTEIADNLELPIPRAWYLYGKTAVCVYDEKEEYLIKESDLPPHIDRVSLNNEFENVMKKYMDYSKLDQFIESICKQSNNTFYESKLKFERLLIGDYSNKDQNMKRIDLAYKLIFNYPDLDHDHHVQELLEAFVSPYVSLILKERIDEKNKIMICDIFHVLWNYISIRQFIMGLSGYYNKSIIKNCLDEQKRTNSRQVFDAVNCMVNLIY